MREGGKSCVSKDGHENLWVLGLEVVGFRVIVFGGGRVQGSDFGSGRVTEG